MKTARSVRLSSTSATTLVNSTAQNGEVFYDQTNKTLRLFDGRTKGGFQLLRADLSNVTGSFGVFAGTAPPSNPQSGTQWLNTNNGIIYIYYVDNNGGHWIQPVTTPIGALIEEPTLLVATATSAGAVQPDGTSIIIDNDGIISAVFSTPSFINSTFVGYTVAQLPATLLNTINGATGTVDHNIAVAGTVFYHTNVADNFTANFTNMPTTNNRSTTITLVIDQNNPSFIPSNVQINGITQTLNWLDGLVPQGTVGGFDVVQFTLVRFNNTWTVTGVLSKHGV
jgi:hypothetical protein